MANSLQRLAIHSRKAYRSALPQLSRTFSTDAVVEKEIKPGEIGLVSGIPEEHLRRKVKKHHTPLFKEQAKVIFTSLHSLGRKPLPVRAFSTSTESQTQKLERIADDLLSLNKLERFDYAILLRHKMGLNRFGPAVSGLESSSGPAGSGPGAASADTKPAEKTVFDVKLEKFDAASKIKVIKEIRGFTELGLKEAKDLVEKAPVVVKKGITKEEADMIMEKLKGIGATVVLE